MWTRATAYSNQLLLGCIHHEPIAWLNSTSTAISRTALQHLGRHPLQPRHPVRRSAAIPVGPVRGAPLDGAGGGVGSGRHPAAAATCNHSRPHAGLIYTAQGVRRHLGAHQSGPANATTTIKTYGYQLSFGGQSQFGLVPPRGTSDRRRWCSASLPAQPGIGREAA